MARGRNMLEFAIQVKPFHEQSLFAFLTDVLVLCPTSRTRTWSSRAPLFCLKMSRSTLLWIQTIFISLSIAAPGFTNADFQNSMCLLPLRLPVPDPSRSLPHRSCHAANVALRRGILLSPIRERRW
jgi:hypothetical protein